MRSYIATFYTHASALKSRRSLSAAGVEAAMSPVPRRLSSSCGTCLRYCAENPLAELLDHDMEAVYEAEGDERYTEVAKNE